MTTEEQLQWERRMSRPAAVAAFAAGLLLLTGTAVFQSILEDRPRIEPLPDFLLSIDDSPGTLIGATALQAAAALCLIFVFFYLFRAIVHRIARIPSWFVYLIFAGPAMYGISQVLGALDRIDVAESFAQQRSSVGECPALEGQAGADCAEDLLRENPNGLAIALSLAGSVGVAFMYVMLPLRARRAGLLSPFMSILGVIAGVLLVLQLVPLVPVVIQAFWLGAIGALFLGNWPGGRGPAWESGRPDPWPAARRGMPTAEGGRRVTDPPPPDEQAAEPEDQPPPERPPSRKRRKR